MRKNTKKVDIIIAAVIILFLLLSQNDRQGVNTVSADTDATEHTALPKAI